MLVGSYFYTYVSYLLNFDIDDVISFDIKYFFLLQRELYCTEEKLGWEKVSWGEWVLKISIQKKKKKMCKTFKKSKKKKVKIFSFIVHKYDRTLIEHDFFIIRI